MNSTKAARILIVDDEAYVREALKETLAGAGHHVESCGAVAAALLKLDAAEFDLLITDLRMPGSTGIDLIVAARRRGLDVPIIVLTGMGTVGDAVEAMKVGAFDFVEKPIEPDQMLRLVGHALEKRSLMSEIGQLRASLRYLRGADRLVGDSAAMAKVHDLVASVGPTDATVLIYGESGTGKELVARAIHDASCRSEKNLVRVNCAAIPEGLFESEFFGHCRGSFSGAVADRVGRFEESKGGSLVLDEIGTLTSDGQAKLLRVLEGGEYQVVGESRTRVADSRIIAVTNEDLRERVTSGAFRADLFYRIEIFPIRVPPLRERRADIGVIAEELMERIRFRIRGSRAPRIELSVAAVTTLESYDWPGNVRELRNVLERALIVSSGETPGADLLSQLLESALSTSRSGSLVAPGDLHLRRNLDGRERELIEAALARAGQRKKDAASMLGIDARNLGYYLRKHDLQTPDRGDP